MARWLRTLCALLVFTSLGLLSAALLSTSDVWADDEPAPAPAPEEPAPEEGEEAEGDTPSAPDGAEADEEGEDESGDDAERRRLRKVYVPFRDLKKIFEKEGEGVFLPYAEFRALWERAHPDVVDEGRPPVAAAVRSATYDGDAEGDTLRLNATLEIDVLGQGWQRLALPFVGIGIERAEIDGKPALLVPTKSGYDLLLKDAGRRILSMTLRAGAPAKGDSHAAKFALPPSPLSKLTLRVPGVDTEVSVAPRLASTRRKLGDGRTEVLAFLGPTAELTLGWRRKVEDAPTIEPLLFAEESSTARVDSGVVRTTLKATVTILRAPLAKLKVRIPEDAAVLFVNGDGLRSWRRAADGKSLDLELREPRKERWAFEVGLERPLPPPPTEVVMPFAFIEGMERERGFVRVDAAEGVKVEAVATPGWIQVDSGELPKAMRSGGTDRSFAWRYASRPGALRMRVEQLAPRIHAAVGTRIGLRPEGLALMAEVRLEVERAGVFQTRLVFDGEVEITDVRVRGVELDDYQQRPREDGQPGSTLDLVYRDRLLGKATLVIVGRRPLNVPDEPGSSILARLPTFVVEGAEHVRGFVGLHVDPALKREEKTRTGLTILDQDAVAALEPPALPADGQAALPLVYRYEHREGDVTLALDLERKAPRITAQVRSRARLDVARTRLFVMLTWNVEFSGVDTFRFKAPLADSLATRIKLEDASLQLLGPVDEAKPGDAPDTWKATHGIWTVRLPAPRTGAVVVGLSIEDQDEASLDQGGSRTVALPTLVPVAVDETPLPNTVHWMQVERDALLQVAPATLTQVEEIDARELPQDMQSPGTFLAFRSYDPAHALSLNATKHEYEAVASIVLQHMHLDTHLPEEGRATTEAFLVVRNNDQQVLSLRLPEGAKLRAVRVAGVDQKPRKGEDGTVLIPLLAGLGKSEAFTIDLAFDHDIHFDGGMFDTWSLETPEAVGEGIHTDLVTWRIFAPREMVWTGFDGTLEPVAPSYSWAHDLLGALGRTFATEPRAKQTDFNRLMRSGASPFGTRMDGTELRFHGRDGKGTVSLSGTRPGTWSMWKLFWSFLALIVTLVLMHLGARMGIARAAVFVALVLFVVALLVPAREGTAAVLSSVFWGVIAGGALGGLAALLRGGRSEASTTAAPEVIEIASAAQEGAEAGDGALPEADGPDTGSGDDASSEGTSV